MRPWCALCSDQAYHSSIWETEEVPSQILSQKKKIKEGETREMERGKGGKETRKGGGRTGEVGKEGERKGKQKEKRERGGKGRARG